MLVLLKLLLTLLLLLLGILVLLEFFQTCRLVAQHRDLLLDIVVCLCEA